MISVVIPLLNEEKNIASLLDTIELAIKKTEEDVEIIIVDGGSVDKTWDICKSRGFMPLRSFKGRGRQINVGIKEAKGDLILVLHGDCLVEENIFTEIRRTIEKGYSWGSCIIKMDSAKGIYRIGEYLSNRRSRKGIAFGDQGIFFKRSNIDDFGPFPEISIMEDYEFSKIRKKHGSKPGIANSKITTSVRRFEEFGPIKMGLKMNILRFFYDRGGDVETINRIYDGKNKSKSKKEDKEDAIIIFTKIPHRGFSKTRLKDTLRVKSHELAACFLKDTIEIAKNACSNVFLFVSPMGLIQEIDNYKELNISPQRGMNLGERMFNAFKEVMEKGYKNVILIGTDIPYLESKILRDALGDLRQKRSIIGPTLDGGYYLIGLNILDFEFFNMDYSHKMVFEDTLARLKAYGETSILKKLDDIDEKEDLDKFIDFLKANNCDFINTENYLRKRMN